MTREADAGSVPREGVVQGRAASSTAQRLADPGATRYFTGMTDAIKVHRDLAAVLAFGFGAIVVVVSLTSLALTLLAICGIHI
nr:hypothetical protein [Mesorhizobium loti]